TVLEQAVTINVLANDTGTDIVLTGVGTPSHGAASSSGDAVTNTPEPDFKGTDSFSYTIRDGSNRTANATVTVTVATKEEQKEQVKETLEETTTDPNAQEIGSVIGGVCVEQTGQTSFQQNCNALVVAAAQGDPSVGRALEQITPEEAAAATEVAQTSAQAQTVNIKARLFALRTGVMGINFDRLNIQRGGWTLSGQDLRYLLASTGGGGPSAPVEASRNAWGIFINGAIDFGDREGTDRQEGFEFKTRALTAGIDYRFTDQLVLGTALSYAVMDSDMDNEGGSLDATGYSLSLYGTYYRSDQFYVDGMINYGRYDYNQQRNVAYQLQDASVNQNLVSQYGGGQFLIDVGAGYRFRHNNFTFGPEVRLSYLTSDVDSFQEQAGTPGGDASWAVAIDSQNLRSLVSSVGGRASYSMDLSWGILQPQMEFSWLHEFNDDAYFVRGQFVQGGITADNFFNLAMDPVDTDYFRLGLGLMARFKRGPSALLQYRTYLDYENLEEHGIMAQLRWEF
ncbi:MAG: hypothetical protein QG599_3137, partial [Pseudomonadota bacterium]|nr:hypothetical protein [Pseudomonadota bacterium]